MWQWLSIYLPVKKIVALLMNRPLFWTLLVFALYIQTGWHAAAEAQNQVGYSRISSVKEGWGKKSITLQTETPASIPRPIIRFLPGENGDTILVADFYGLLWNMPTKVIEVNSSFANSLPVTTGSASKRGIKLVRIGKFQEMPPICRVAVISSDPQKLKTISFDSKPGRLTIKWSGSLVTGRNNSSPLVAPDFHQSQSADIRQIAKAPPLAPPISALDPHVVASNPPDNLTLRPPIGEKAPEAQKLEQNQPSANTQASNVSPHKSKQYQPRPLQSHHGTSKLYACYQQEQSIASTRYKAEWTKLRNRRDTLIQRAKNSAQTKRSLIKAAAAGKLGKRALYKTVSLQFKMTLQTIKHDYRNDYAKLKARCQKMGWLDWLVLNAKNGDLEALEVLRSRNSKCINRTANHISGGQNPNDPHKTDSIESITRHGNILVRTGAVIVRDNGKQLIVSSKATQESYAAILETAIARYGQRLSINGDDRFKAGIVQAAAQNRIRVTFDDAKLSQFHRQLIHGQHTRSTQYKGMSR